MSITAKAKHTIVITRPGKDNKPERTTVKPGETRTDWTKEEFRDLNASHPGLLKRPGAKEMDHPALPSGEAEPAVLGEEVAAETPEPVVTATDDDDDDGLGDLDD